jgi:hypothetical protein
MMLTGDSSSPGEACTITCLWQFSSGFSKMIGVRYLVQ